MHNNERATQIRLLKQLFFSPIGYPDWCLAQNVIEQDRQYGSAKAKVLGSSNSTVSNTQNIKLSPIWKILKTVKELQDLLKSPTLYQNPEAYAALSAGFESGHMRQTTYLEPQRLSKTLTTATEAHLRMELWYSLNRPSFSHGLSQVAYDNCVAMWREMIPRVFKDRTDNEDAAWTLRLKNIQLEEANDEDMGDGNDSNNDGDAAHGQKDEAPFILDAKYL